MLRRATIIILKYKVIITLDSNKDLNFKQRNLNSRIERKFHLMLTFVQIVSRVHQFTPAHNLTRANQHSIRNIIIIFLAY